MPGMGGIASRALSCAMHGWPDMGLFVARTNTIPMSADRSRCLMPQSIRALPTVFRRDCEDCVYADPLATVHRVREQHVPRHPTPLRIPGLDEHHAAGDHRAAGVERSAAGCRAVDRVL